MSDFNIIGKSPPRIDAPAKVTGKAMYAADFHAPGMLHLKMVGSRYPHAVIKRIDTSKAARLPGVRGFVLPEDVPDRRTGGLLSDRYVLPRDGVVRFTGEPILMVAADSLDIAEDAAELVAIEYEPLPSTLTLDESCGKSPAVIVHPDLPRYKYMANPRYPQILDSGQPNVANMAVVRKGDTEKGFAESDLIVENDYYCAPVSHCPIETHIYDGWIAEDGTLTLRLSSQGSHPTIGILSELYGIPSSKIRIITPYCGAGFGSKSTVHWPQRLMAAAVLKLRRYCRWQFNREEDLTVGYRRTGVKVHIKDGVKRDGTLVAREVIALMDAGAYADAIVPGLPRLLSYGVGVTYRIPNVKVDGYAVYTNTPPTSTMRGVGVPQVVWAIEQQMDIIAEKLHLDAVEVRRKNILTEEDENAFAEKVESIGARQCLDKVAEWIKWGEKPSGGDGWLRGKGVSVAGAMNGRGYTASSIVKVHPDSTIEVRFGSGEIGQGSATVAAQICAEEFKTTIDKVKVVMGDTAITPFDFIAQSSHITLTSGNAVIRACRDARRQICEIAAAKMGMAAADLEVVNGVIRCKDLPQQSLPLSGLFTPQGFIRNLGEIIGRGEFTSPALSVDPKTGAGPKQAYWSYGAYAVEVAVNPVTGEIKVLRVAGAFDMGQPINLKMCEQQIDGGMGMGISTSIYEELMFKDGQLRNPDLVNYKLATAMETPGPSHVASFAVGAPHAEGPYGAKGLGEIVLAAFAPAVGNAVYNATGRRIMELPLKRETVWRALQAAKTGPEIAGGVK